jgi:hypothetical protein
MCVPNILSFFFFFFFRILIIVRLQYNSKIASNNNVDGNFCLYLFCVFHFLSSIGIFTWLSSHDCMYSS